MILRFPARPLVIATALLVTRALADAPDAVVTFNEVHYHPAGSQDDEWIELHNQMAVNVDVSGWSLADGVSYRFPAGTVIPGGGYRLIAKSLANPALAGIPGVLGPFTGNLSNSGETLDLLNPSGRLMDRLAYQTSGEWPETADGAGATLAKRRPGLASEPAASWVASSRAGGTPAAANFAASDAPVTSMLIDTAAPWRYNDVAAPASDWNARSFDGSTWSQGAGPFGTAGVSPVLAVTADLVEHFDAGSLSGLADGARFDTWPDLATAEGVSQDATAASDPRYETNAVATRPSISFDGNDGFRTALPPGISPGAGFVYFIVCKATAAPTGGSTNDGSGDYLFDRDNSLNDNPLVSLKAVNGRYGFQKRFDDGGGIGGPVSTTAISTTKYQIVALRRNPAQARFEIWVDGAMEASVPDDGRGLTPQPIVIGQHGSTPSQGFTGEIAELLIYRDPLSEDDFQKVGSYLTTRYDLETAFPDATVQTTLQPAAATSYFRSTFTFTGNPAKTALELDSTVADGAVFYLNGQEIARTNLPAGTIGHGTAALSDVTQPSATGFQSVPSSALVTGANVLAVSLHRAAAGTGSFFSARLRAIETPASPDEAQRLQLNEVAGTHAAAFFIELRNPNPFTVDTTGFRLELSGSQSASFPLPAAQVPAGGLIHYPETLLGGHPAAGDKVILYGPDDSPVDARTVDLIDRGLSDLWPGRWLFPAAETPGLPNAFDLQQDVVINEICYHPPEIDAASEDKQWLELYNRGSSPVSLGGWRFGSGIEFTFPAGATLAPHAYLVVAKNPAGLLAAFPGTPVTGPYSSSLAGSGERILLLDAAGNPADEVSYLDGGRWPGAADGEGSTLELRDPHADNSLPDAWAASDEAGRRTWRTYTYRATAEASKVGPDGAWRDFVFGLLDSGDVLLDDITVTENPDTNPVAMISGGDFESGLSGWRFLGNHRHAELVPDPAQPGNTVLHLSAKGPTEPMHNHVETTLSAGRSVVNGRVYQISFRACWLSGSNRLNTRLYFNRVARTTLLDRTDNPGTPGAPNSTLTGNIGPAFLSVAHSPAVPAPAQPVTLTARVADPDGIDALTLHYSVAGGAYTDLPMTAGGDGASFTAAIPGQAGSAIVRFYVSAQDAAAVPASSSYPADGADGHALYQVNDGLATSNGRHNLRIVMAPDDRELLYRTTNLMSNERLGCTVIYDEREIYYDAGVRLKSSERGRPVASRVGFNLGFNKDQLFRGIHGSVSIDRSEGQAPGCQEILYDHMMYASGSVPAEYNDLCKVLAPDPAHTGSAILQLARFGDVFLDSQFENGGDGTSYEYELIYYPTTADAAGYKLPQPDDVVGTAIADLGDDKESYRWNYLIENNEDLDDYSRVLALAKQFGKSGAAFESGLDSVIDIDQWLSALACSCATGAGDSFFSNAHHNGIFYARPDGRVLYFPHDLDFQYDATRSIYENAELQKLVANPGRRRTYLGYLHHLCTTVFNAGYMAPWTSHYGSLLPGEDFSAHLSYITQRSNYILSAVNTAIPPVNFAITTNGGADFSSNLSPVVLSGSGWVNVRGIRLTGSTIPLQVTWSGSTTWQVSVPLAAGANLISLEALDFDGQVIGTDQITVTNTGSLQQPQPATLVISEIYYNPPGSVETTEYVELMNTSTATLDLSNVNFSKGITFTFPGGTTLGAGARVLVVKDQAAFTAAFGTGRPIAGTFPNSLDNSGEQLELLRADGGVLHSFRYSDQPPWPVGADGDGFTLVLVSPYSDPDHNDPASWRASSVAGGGSPGTADTIAYQDWKAGYGNPADDDDADGDGLTTRLEYFLGGDPTHAEPELRPTFARDAQGIVTLTITRRAQAEEAAIAPQISTDLTTWQSVSSQLVSNVRLAGAPVKDRLTYRIVPPADAARFFTRFRIGP